MGYPISTSRPAVFDENMDETPNNDMTENNNNDDFEYTENSDDTENLADTERLDSQNADPAFRAEADDTSTSSFTISDADTEQDKTLQDELNDETEPDVGAVPPTSPVPPAFVPTAPNSEDRLVRDPNVTFGGVLSGIAHRYGWDVALTRLAFIVVLLISGGFAIPLYFIAWLVIPRATLWPPRLVRNRLSRGSGGLSARDLGIGLLGIAVIIALGVGSGEAAAIVVPLALIGAGVWLLTQNPRVAVDPVPAGAAVAGAEPTFAPAFSGSGSGAPTPPQQPIAQQPVVPSSRGRRAVKFGIFGFLALLLLAVIAIPLGVIAIVFNGDFDVDFGERVIVLEDEIPALIEHDAGELIIDLRSFDFSEVSEPEMLEVQLDAGSIEVILPDDVRVDVDAFADFGELNVFGETTEFGERIFIVEDDPRLILDVDVDFGEATIVRDDGRVLDSVGIERR